MFRFPQASSESLPHSVVPSATADDLARGNPEASIPGPDRYICVCFPGITYKKYLHHVDVNRAADDPMLFTALKRKYFDWKPLWRRVLTLRTLARVEYFEVSIAVAILCQYLSEQSHNVSWNFSYELSGWPQRMLLLGWISLVTASICPVHFSQLDKSCNAKNWAVQGLSQQSSDHQRRLARSLSSGSRP